MYIFGIEILIYTSKLFFYFIHAFIEWMNLIIHSTNSLIQILNVSYWIIEIFYL